MKDLPPNGLIRIALLDGTADLITFLGEFFEAAFAYLICRLSFLEPLLLLPLVLMGRPHLKYFP